jgi:hypothetical protein
VKKPFLIAFALLSAFSSSFAFIDSLTAPRIDFVGNKIFTGFERMIKNPTDKSIEFCFHDFPQTDSQFMADYILSKITNKTDTPAAQLEVIRAAVHFLKSPKYYMNNQLIFDGQWNDESLFAKEHSLIGRIFSTTSTQCGNNSEQGRMIGLASGYFQPQDFRHVTLPNHAFIETKIGGYFALTDYDVGTCVFMVKNPNSPNGWASFADVNTTPSLITDKYMEDGIDFHPAQNMDDYRATMASPTFNVGVFPWNRTEVINGAFILPPHSQLVFETIDMIHFIDTVAPGVSEHYHAMMNAVATYEQALSTGNTCAACIDTFMLHLSIMYGGDSALVENYLDKIIIHLTKLNHHSFN